MPSPEESDAEEHGLAVALQHEIEAEGASLRDILARAISVERRSRGSGFSTGSLGVQRLIRKMDARKNMKVAARKNRDVDMRCLTHMRSRLASVRY